MDRLDAMALFLSALDDGSLAAAARRNGRSPATVTRAVALLERHAGEPLLLRSTRRLSLTAAGVRHAAIWRDVLASLRAAGPGSATGPLQGTIVLTAPELFGRLKVMPIVGRFLCDHPSVAARVLMLNRLADLAGEGIDLAVRLAPLTDSTLKAVRVGNVRTLLCASPDYLARGDALASPADLHRHECIGLNARGDGELWSFGSGTGALTQRSVHVRTRLSLNNAGAGLDAAIAGQGLVRARSYQVTAHLAAGRLVRVLPAFEPPPTPVHLVFHPARADTGALRAFIEHAAPELRRELLAIDADLVVSAG